MEKQKTAAKRITVTKGRLLWVLIGAAWLFVLLKLLVNSIFEDNTSLVAAFAVTEPKAVSASVEVTAKYPLTLFDEKEKTRLMEQLSEAIGLTLGEDARVQWVNTESREELVITKAARAAETELKAITLFTASEVDYGKDTAEVLSNKTVSQKHYVYAKISLEESMETVLAYKTLLEDTLEKLSCTEISTTIQLVGDYDGYLTVEKRDALTEKMLKALEAEVMYEYRTKELYTVYAYTASLENYITVENKKINLHIAFSQDEEQYRTILYLASPILPDTW